MHIIWSSILILGSIAQRNYNVGFIRRIVTWTCPQGHGFFSLGVTNVILLPRLHTGSFHRPDLLASLDHWIIKAKWQNCLFAVWTSWGNFLLWAPLTFDSFPRVTCWICQHNTPKCVICCLQVLCLFLSVKADRSFTWKETHSQTPNLDPYKIHWCKSPHISHFLAYMNFKIFFFLR